MLFCKNKNGVNPMEKNKVLCYALKFFIISHYLKTMAIYIRGLRHNLKLLALKINAISSLNARYNANGKTRHDTIIKFNILLAQKNCNFNKPKLCVTSSAKNTKIVRAQVTRRRDLEFLGQLRTPKSPHQALP